MALPPGVSPDSSRAVYETLTDQDRPASVFSRLLAATADANPIVVKEEAGYLLKIIGRNNAAALRYLKIYNKATAPTEADTPVMTFDLVASQAFSIDLGMAYFSAGISYRITTGQADNDTGALTAGDISGLNVLAA